MTIINLAVASEKVGSKKKGAGVCLDIAG